MGVARYAAFLRAVNVGRRRVAMAMAKACEVLTDNLTTARNPTMLTKLVERL